MGKSTSGIQLNIEGPRTSFPIEAISAVQQAGRRMAGQPPPLGTDLQAHEHVGSQPIPVEAPVGWRMWYSVYFDNWDQFTVADWSLFDAVEGKASPEQLAVRETWARKGVTRNAAKAIEARTCGDCLGVAIDGDAGISV